MPETKKLDCDKCQGTGLADFAGFGLSTCRWCDGKGTVKEYLTVPAGVKKCLTTEPVSNPYKFKDADIQLCRACGALPCEGGRYNYHRSHFIEEPPRMTRDEQDHARLAQVQAELAALRKERDAIQARIRVRRNRAKQKN